jgi:multisubunit Na+/H+ antiporter MnhC subunit
MANIYAPVMRALVVVALVLATATLMFVAVNTARAASEAGPPASSSSY